MADTTKVTAAHLQRVAVVYVRQSTPARSSTIANRPRASMRLAEQGARARLAVRAGQVIDEDLGLSGSVVSLANARASPA